ncbi:MAG: BamA/TamA family outer membrane protein [Parachlamydiales bacterium]|nr:BamA/TamA family outer membrane protein [Parachlamydiales bacterium]
MNRIILFLLFFLGVFADSTIHSIVLLKDKDDPVRDGNCGIVFSQNLCIPGSQSNLTKQLTPFIGCPIEKETLLDLKKAISGFYRKNNRPIVAIQIPEQDISDGLLKIIILEAQIENVSVKGNCYFKDCLFLKGMRTQPNCPLDSKTILQDVMWFNLNPFRRVDVIYDPGKEYGSTNVTLFVQDRRPYRFFTGIDNTGNDVTGNNRLFAGLNWGNVFGSDQILNYQYTASSNFSRLQSHVLSYIFPLPWRHQLLVYGGYSSIDTTFSNPQSPDVLFNEKGFTLQGSFRYQIPLPVHYNFLQEFSFGYDFKRTNNDLLFGESPVNPNEKNVNLGQFMASYNIGYESDPIQTTFEIEAFWSPGQWYSDQKNSDYSALRFDAKNYYIYGRSSYTFSWHFVNPFLLDIALRGQLASENLLPSETFGIGGYNTVRGYKERTVNGDQAFISNLELKTNPKSFLCYMYKKPWVDLFQALLFFDYGVAVKAHPVNFEKRKAFLSSVGPGIRFQIPPYVNVRLDWGIQLNHMDSLDNLHQRLHFSCIASY